MLSGLTAMDIGWSSVNNEHKSESIKNLNEELNKRANTVFLLRSLIAQNATVAYISSIESNFDGLFFWLL